MPRVYRVETPHQKGMYHSDTNGFLAVGIDDRMRHPVPRDDSRLCRNLIAITGNDYFQSHHYFGFLSIDQLKRWIYMDEWRVALDAMGYKVSVYEVPVVIEGDTQAIFTLKAPSTTLIERIPLTAI